MRFLLALLLLATPLLAAEKPNIVYILADDMGINDLSCYGRKDQPSPNLDALAKRGMRFTNAYCAQPICSASRAAILTGRSPARLHITTFLPGRADAPSQKLLNVVVEQQLPLAEQTLAELLKPQGYTSACIGKWHLGGKGFLPGDQGFDVVFAGRANTKPTATEGGKGEYELTEHAVKFIEESKDKPFFLYLAHNCPHVPLAAKPELVTKHAGAFNPLYAAMIETFDDSVRLVLEKLNQLDLTKNTIVIFASDNGGLHVPELPDTPATTNAPYRAGKGYLYEGGLREPLIVSWPGHIEPGSECATPVVLADLMPTLLEVAGAPIPGNLDFVSIRTLLEQKGPLAPRDLFWHCPHYMNQGSKPAGAVHSGNWKLIEHYEDGHAELFDLEKDPAETTDRSMDEPAVVAQLRGKLEAWRRSVGAQENEANPAYQPELGRPIYVDTDTSKVQPAPTFDIIRTRLTDWRNAMDTMVSPAVQKQVRPATAPTGFLILPAKTATVHGSTLRYEEKPEKNTLGYWTKAEDSASWDFELPAAAKYQVELLAGCGRGSGGSTVEIKSGSGTLLFTVPETGHFQNFVPRQVGVLDLVAGKNTISVVPKTKAGAAVMDLRRITLTVVGGSGPVSVLGRGGEWSSVMVD